MVSSQQSICEAPLKIKLDVTEFFCFRTLKDTFGAQRPANLCSHENPKNFTQGEVPDSPLRSCNHECALEERVVTSISLKRSLGDC